MRTWMVFGALLLGPAVASAQDDMEKRMQELRRDHDRARKQLEEKFQAEMKRMEEEFRKRAEDFQRQRGEHGRPGGDEHRGPGPDHQMERLMRALHQLAERVERLEQELRGRGGDDRRERHDFRPDERRERHDFRPEERRGDKHDFRPEERHGDKHDRPKMDCPCKGKCEPCHPRPERQKKPQHYDYY